MSKVKEKAPVGKQLKEKVQAAPKELLRRGLSDGTQRLRGQFRDTTQRGQRDGYGGDQIEDATWAGGRWAKRGIQKLLKQKKNGRGKEPDHSSPTPPESPVEPPSWDNPAPPDLPEHPAPQVGTEHVRIKTREAVARSGTEGTSEAPLIKSEFKEAQKSSGPKIKARDSVLQPHSDAVTSTSETPAPFELPTIEKGPERVRIKTKESVPQSGSAVRPQFENRQIKQRSSFFRPRSASPTQTADTPGSFESLAPKERPKRVPIKTRTPAMDQHSGTVIPDKKPGELPSQARRGFRAQEGVSRIFSRAKESLGGRPPVSDEIPSAVPSSTPQYNWPIIKTKDMPIMEIQSNGPDLAYAPIMPHHKRTFSIGNTVIGLSNKFSSFQKDKFVILQDNHLKYRLKETNRLNWALRSFLPEIIFALCLLFLIFFPRYEPLVVILFIVSLIIINDLFHPQYVVIENDVEIGVSGENGKNPIRSFSIKKDIYHIYHHSRERYSLFKNGTQIALYERKLEKWRNKYLIYYAAEEPSEIVELFGIWIDMRYYNDKRGQIILKSYSLSDKHPEYAFWRPRHDE